MSVNLRGVRIEHGNPVHSVTVTGERNDAADLIGAADVFALSSADEALPIVVLEALALGTPVVSTDVGGIPDVVTDGETGLLVPPRDAPAMRAAVERLLGDADLRGRLGGAGRDFARERFGWDGVIERTLGVYRRALEA